MVVFDMLAYTLLITIGIFVSIYCLCWLLVKIEEYLKEYNTKALCIMLIVIGGISALYLTYRGYIGG